MKTDLSKISGTPLSGINTYEYNSIRVYTINEKGEKVFKNLDQFSSRQTVSENVVMKKNHDIKTNRFYTSQLTSLADAIKTLINRRKCFCFQRLKQFFLFPNDPDQSLMSVSPYDKILFDDESIHTMVRMYETKEKQNLIWGFLNIKFWKIYVKVQKITKKVQKIVTKIQNSQIREGMKYIKSYSMMISPKKPSKVPTITRVISASVVSMRHPGKIYQSDHKKKSIIQNQTDYRQEYPKLDESYKVTIVTPKQHKIQPSVYSTYSPSYKYASKSHINNSHASNIRVPNNINYCQHYHQPIGCDHSHQSHHVHPGYSPHYCHCCPQVANCCIILQTNCQRICSCQNNCGSNPHLKYPLSCQNNFGSSYCQTTRRVYEGNDRQSRQRGYDFNSRVNYMFDLERDIEQNRQQNHIRASSLVREFRQ